MFLRQGVFGRAGDFAGLVFWSVVYERHLF
jgi:hypothetical protein